MTPTIIYTVEAYFGPRRGWKPIPRECRDERHAREVANVQANDWGRRARIFRTTVELIVEVQPEDRT